MIWAHATKLNPCPICSKDDYCTFGDRAMLCQRVESKWPALKGGYYHYYGESKPEYIPQAKAAPKSIDAISIVRKEYQIPGNSREKILDFANNLGVSQPSLIQLGCYFSTQYKSYAFPMSDGDGNYIGIRLRNSAGFKWAVPGSRQGIFLPNISYNETKICYLPEGPTDTAALLTMGLFAIGRPTCNSGNDHIKVALKRLGIYRAVIIADNDELKATGNRPGLDGARKLKKELGLASVIWMPPSPLKDVRQFLNKGGTRQMIESEIKNKIWSKL